MKLSTHALVFLIFNGVALLLSFVGVVLTDSAEDMAFLIVLLPFAIWFMWLMNSIRSVLERGKIAPNLASHASVWIVISWIGVAFMAISLFNFVIAPSRTAPSEVAQSVLTSLITVWALWFLYQVRPVLRGERSQ